MYHNSIISSYGTFLLRTISIENRVHLCSTTLERLYPYSVLRSGYFIYCVLSIHLCATNIRFTDTCSLQLSKRVRLTILIGPFRRRRKEFSDFKGGWFSFSRFHSMLLTAPGSRQAENFIMFFRIISNSLYLRLRSAQG